MGFFNNFNTPNPGNIISSEAEEKQQEFQYDGDQERYRYYIWAVYMGRVIVRGPFADERAAQSAGLNKMNVRFNTVYLKTVDLGAATSMIKERHVQNTGELDTAMKRASHQMSYIDKGTQNQGQEQGQSASQVRNSEPPPAKLKL